MSVPTYTRAIDSYFLSTWDEIQKEAADNIMLGTPIVAALKLRGCFKNQSGGHNVDRTIRYALPTPVGVSKGDVMPAGEVETQTMALWPFRQIAVGIQRDATDDVANAGMDKIKDYVATRVTDAQDSMSQQTEKEMLNPLDTFTDNSEDGRMKHFLGINDMVPPHASASSGNYGGILRSNSYWQPKYYQRQANPEINYRTDMVHMYNVISANQEPPDFIITDQANFELYEEEVVDKIQIVKASTTKLADLGFEVLYFKGQEMIWSPNMDASGTTGDTLMLNSKWIEVVREPKMWNEMTEWKSAQLSLTRVSQILARCVMVSRQLRRHGRLYDPANA